MELRDYQRAGVNLALNHIADLLHSSNNRLLIAGPTGTGKSYVEIGIMEKMPNLILISPKEEIIDGLIEKGMNPKRVFTPMKLLNQLRGGLEIPCDGVLFDEVHHWLADTWQEIEQYLDCKKYIGFTGSPYRGTLKETNEFLEEWGKPVWLIDYPSAFAHKLIYLPSIEIVPLLNDDSVEIRAGEFVATQIESMYQSKLSDLMRLVEQRAFSKPTIISVSGKEFAYFLHESLDKKLNFSNVILAETSKKERYKAIDDCLNYNYPIIQIQTIGEGVDYPFQQIIDLSPIFSPVKWVQLLGRIMRVPGEYICTNRNIIRHAYLLQGCIPTKIIQEDQKLFGEYQRATNRLFTLETLGKFKPTQVITHNGIGVSVYFLESLIENQVVKFAAIYHPQCDTGMYAYRTDIIKTDGKREWGKWKRIATLPEQLKGFTSQSKGPVTEGQYNWWKRAALKHGLDPQQPITRKEFEILPLLNDMGISLKG